MDQFTLLLIILNSCLSIGLVFAAIYYLVLCYKTYKIQRHSVAKAKSIEKGFTLIDHPIMRYSDYKKNFGSRSREIAIIGIAKQPDIIETIAEFTEAMRENGSYIYHFTHYWGSADQKETQRIVSEAILNNYHGILTIGSSLTKLAKNIGITHNKFTPVVFARVLDPLWKKEQEKKPVTHMTGITALDCWEYRIKMYLAVKPFMRSALIPLTHPSLYDSAQEIINLLNSYGIMPHMVRVHGTEDLLNTLSDYADKADSLIMLRDECSSEACTAIAKKCSEYNMTFFSPYLKDIHYGAAVAMNSVHERFGYLAAQQMLSIIEDNQSPKDIPIHVIDQAHPYEMHFNQLAMHTQGLDTYRITSLALHYSNKVYATIDKDIEQL